MTGKDLIIYILQNGLENKPVIENGHLLGFMNELEAAVKFKVGTATIRVWIDMGHLDGFKIGNTIYIPANSTDPRDKMIKHC